MHCFVIFFICIFAHFSLQSFEPLKSYSASYKLSTRNIEIGMIERNFWIKDDGNYQFSSTLSSAGIGKLISSLSRTQISTGKFNNGQFIPTSYTHKTQQDKRSYELDFDRVTARTSDTDLALAHNPIVLDELSYQAQLRADLLYQVNKYEYLVQKKHKQKLYKFQRSKAELVTTTLGKFTCDKMIRVTNNPDKTIKIWIAEELGYIPVKIELTSNQKKTIAILTKISQND